MGLFICFSRPSKYKLQEHTSIEQQLVNNFGFQEISLDDCNKIVQLILRVTNDKGETFCKYLDKNGVPQGIATSTIGGHTSGDETILILSTRDNFNEIETGNDIRAILAFNYEDYEYKNIDINVLCSNQVTKLGGGKILLENLINVSRLEGMKKITLFAAESAINFYKKFGFVNESKMFSTMLSLQLGGKHMACLVLNLKSRRRTKSKRKRKRKTKSKK
jgi:hypothetical protein